MEKEIDLDSARAGMLIDGKQGTPYVVATLYNDAAEGLHAAIPYVSHLDGDQFTEVERWFAENGAALPANLGFQDFNGSVSLFGTQYLGSSRSMPSGIAFGRFAISEAVAGRRSAPVQDPLLVSELQSKFDGLGNWTGFRAGQTSVNTDDEGRATRLTIIVESTEEMEWQFEDATFLLSTTWHGRSGESLGAEEAVILTTRFSEARRASEHLRLQDSIRSLVAVMFGTGIYFRRHDIKSDSFSRQLPSGTTDYPLYHFVSGMTQRDLNRPTPKPERLARPLVSANHLGTDGLEKWAMMQEPWSRVIGPVAGILQREQPFVEDTILTTSMAIEARGHMLPPSADETATTSAGKPRNPSFRDYALRCLNEVNLDWSLISASTEALASAMSHVYNGVKHPNRPLPDSLDAALLGPIQLWLARLCIMRSLDETGEILRVAAQHHSFSQDMNAFQWNNRYISASGKFTSWPTA